MFTRSGYWFIGLTVAAVAAFWPRYLSRPPGEVDAYTHVHAALMTAWCGLLIAQPFLVRAGRRPLHRALGRVSYGLVPALLVASVLLAHLRFRVMDEATFRAEASFLYLPLSSVVLFGLAWALGVGYRHEPALHARFMVGTALTLIDPVLARILVYWLPPVAEPIHYQAFTYGFTDLVLLVLIVRERAQPRARWALPLLLACFVAAHVVGLTAARGESWHAFARWFRELPLT